MTRVTLSTPATDAGYRFEVDVERRDNGDMRAFLCVVSPKGRRVTVNDYAVRAPFLLDAIADLSTPDIELSVWAFDDDIVRLTLRAGRIPGSDDWIATESHGCNVDDVLAVLSKDGVGGVIRMILGHAEPQPADDETPVGVYVAADGDIA